LTKPGCVRRLKGSNDSTHTVQGDELRALRKLQRENPHAAFVSECGAPFSADGFQKMIERLAAKAGLTALKPHPRMFRHACGHKLANEGRDTRAIQDYLGHTNIQNVVRYTALSPNRFKDFRWSRGLTRLARTPSGRWRICRQYAGPTRGVV
jgi:site-specific recombinase XerD